MQRLMCIRISEPKSEGVSSASNLPQHPCSIPPPTAEPTSRPDLRLCEGRPAWTLGHPGAALPWDDGFVAHTASLGS